MKIHQMLPNFSYGDAIGDDTLALQKIFINLGNESRIYAGVIHPYLTDQACHYKMYPVTHESDRLLVYHFSVGSEIVDFINQIPDRLVIIFHNITPPEWFFGVSPHMVELAARGLQQLESLVSRCEIAWADSQYNADILVKIGFQNVHVLPIIIDFNRLNLPVNALFQRTYQSSLTTWMFPGRLTPNKCHQDIIKAFAVYQKCINPHSRLFLVGDMKNCSKYAQAMVDLVRKLGVSNVIFTGMIDDDELVTLYQMTDVFVCMSEHEGFCVPLLEAMYFHVPVIAFDAGAVSGTMGSAGILVRKKSPELVAELADKVINDVIFRTRIVERQDRRIKDVISTDYTCKVRALLGEISK